MRFHNVIAFTDDIVGHQVALHYRDGVVRGTVTDITVDDSAIELRGQVGYLFDTVGLLAVDVLDVGDSDPVVV